MAELFKLVGAAAAIYNLLGPWGTGILVGVLALFCCVVYVHGGSLLEWWLLRTARSIGAVLRDATVTVHSITAAPEPDRSVWVQDEDDEAFEADLAAADLPEGNYDWYYLDLTITPKANSETGSDQGWEPSALQLARADRKLDALDLDVDCLVAQVEGWQGGQFGPCQEQNETVHGARRLRLHAGFTAGMDHVQLVYLGHALGELHLPAVKRSTMGAPGSDRRPIISTGSTREPRFRPVQTRNGSKS
jgi:hypothetical protein